MLFVYYFLAFAIVLIIFHKFIEDNVFGNENNNEESGNTHAHRLIVDIGDTLINKEGIEQYKELKPKLEQVKRYYLNNENRQQVTKVELESNKPVELKIVS